VGTWFRRHPLAVALVTLGVLFAVVIAGEIAFPTRGETLAASPARRLAAAEAKLLPPVVAMGVDQEYPETAARPLWTPTRRPAPEQVAAAQNSFQTGQYQLQGVIIAGDTRVAMLREKANGKMHRVELGKDVNGIKVAEIQPEAVTLAMGSQNEVLPLSVSKGVAAAAAPHAAASPFAAPAAAPGAPPNPLATNAPPAPPGTSPPVPPTPAAPGAAPAQNPATAAFGRYPAVNEPPAPAAGAPLSPEELLARRRARRTQQTQ
jgi:general secretion pathway protein N